MKSIVKKITQALLLVPMLALSVSVAVPATSYAADCDPSNLSITSGADCAQGQGQATDLFGGGSVFEKVTNILLFLVGAISVIMLIIGGIRYVISAGDQAQVTSAKNTILYAIVGIVVAFLAFAAVKFVTNSLGTSA